MGRVVANFFISLDGVVEAPDQWHFPYFDDDMGRVVGEGMGNAKAMLLGRRLYDEWSEYWPAQAPEEPFSAHINGIQKYVLTHRPLDGEPWTNTTVLGATPDADAVTEVQAVKDRTDGDIAMSGCATTVRWLLAHGLLDELLLLVHPIAVAKGQRLFEDTGTVQLTLESSETLASGVLFLRYSPVAAD